MLAEIWTSRPLTGPSTKLRSAPCEALAHSLVRFTLAVAGPGRRERLDFENGHPRAHSRTQPTLIPSNTGAEAMASTLLPVD